MDPNKTMLVIGDGWLANIIAPYFVSQGYTVIHHKAYIKDPLLEIHEDLKNSSIIVNLIGKTNIDWCEKHKLDCVDSNIDLPVWMASECTHHSKYFVHFSSACIYESKNERDWKDEDSAPSPQCFYAKSKEMAEHLVTEQCPYSLIPRIRLPLSEKSHKRNTLDKLRGYTHVNNSQESVTVIEDALPVLKSLIEKRVTGTVNLINEGTISPAELCDWMKHPYLLRSKEDQDKDMAEEGRAKRVTALVRSNRVSMLPDIRGRMPALMESYLKSLS